MTDSLKKAELIDLEKIDIKASPMVKAVDHEDTIQEYWDCLIDGAKFPPIDLFWIDDLNAYVIADGRKRFYAHERNNEEQILAFVHRGGERKALEFALGGGNPHGMRPTDADYKCSLKIILQDPEWGNRSNRAIAEMMKVSEQKVRRLRKAFEPDVKEKDAQSEGDDQLRQRGAVDGEATESAEKPRATAKPKANQEQTKRVGRDGKERRLPTPKTGDDAPGGKEKISPEQRKEVKAAFGAFVRAVNKVPEWKELLGARLESIAADMKSHWGRGGK